MKDIILQAIKEYESEPQGLIRVIPDPEVLADWIYEAIREKVL